MWADQVGVVVPKLLASSKRALPGDAFLQISQQLFAAPGEVAIGASLVDDNLGNLLQQEGEHHVGRRGAVLAIGEICRGSLATQT